jgi:hypothetical protein
MKQVVANSRRHHPCLTGSRVGSEDTFSETSTPQVIATEPWYTNHLVTNLTPGNWNLSVTVNGQTMSLPIADRLSSWSPGDGRFPGGQSHRSV